MLLISLSLEIIVNHMKFLPEGSICLYLQGQALPVVNQGVFDFFYHHATSIAPFIYDAFMQTDYNFILQPFDPILVFFQPLLFLIEVDFYIICGIFDRGRGGFGYPTLKICYFFVEEGVLFLNF